MQSLKPAQLAFFSYAHEDAEFALRLAKDLRAGGATVWMDRLDIKPGERWDRAIEDALAKCPQMLVILSPAAVESTNVMDEVSLALEEGKTVLPVIHRNCKIPFRLRRLQHVDLTLNYEAGLGRLLETLGFATPSSEMPVQDVERDLAASSDRDGGTEEINLLSPAASQEHEATLPMPKKRVFGWVMATIGIVAVLVALGLKFAAITRTKSYQSPMRVAIQPTSTSPAAESKATPVEKVKRLARPQRTITVLKPEIELPALKTIVVVAAGEADNPMASIGLFNAGEANRYDEPIRIPPDVKTEKFDVVWLPKDGRRVILVRDLAFDQEHPSHEIKPNEHIGLVRLGGKELPKAKAIYLAEAGANNMTVPLSAVQKAEKYGENMAAPPGTYDVYIDVADEKRLELVAEKLEVKAGTVTEVD
jgi:hypothetical protein